MMNNFNRSDRTKIKLHVPRLLSKGEKKGTILVNMADGIEILPDPTN
jgi:hypothetical protein